MTRPFDISVTPATGEAAPLAGSVLYGSFLIGFGVRELTSNRAEPVPTR